MSPAGEPPIGGQDFRESGIRSGQGGNGPAGGRGGDVGAHNHTNIKTNHTSNAFMDGSNITGTVTSVINRFGSAFFRGNGNVGNTIIHQAGNNYTVNDQSNHTNNSSHVANDNRQYDTTFRVGLPRWGSRPARPSPLAPNGTPASTLPKEPANVLSRHNNKNIIPPHDSLSERLDEISTEVAHETCSQAEEFTAGAEFSVSTTQVETTSVPAAISEDSAKETEAIHAQSSIQLESACLMVNNTAFPTSSSPLDVNENSAETTESNNSPAVDTDSRTSDWVVRSRRQTELQLAEITTVTAHLQASVVASMSASSEHITTSTDGCSDAGSEGLRPQDEQAGDAARDDSSDSSSSISTTDQSESSSATTNITSPAPSTSALPPNPLPLQTVPVVQSQDVQDCGEYERERKRDALDLDIRALMCALTADLPAQLFRHEDDKFGFSDDLRKLVYELANEVHGESGLLGRRNFQLYSFSEQETAGVPAQLRKEYTFAPEDVKYVMHLTNLFLSKVMQQMAKRLPRSSQLEIPNICHEYGPLVAIIFCSAIELRDQRRDTV